MTKHEEPTETPAAPAVPPIPAPAPVTPTPERKSESALSIVSLVLGVLSLTGPGLLLGIPAIVTAAIALKKNEGGRGLSITGLITGIVSTIVSILFIIFFIWFIAWSINNPEALKESSPAQPGQAEQMFNGSET